MQSIGDAPAQSLNNSVFNLQVYPHRLPIASNDSVTAVAATGGTLWVGTQLGKLIRHDTINHTNDEVKGRLGAGRSDTSIWKIFPDARTRSALIILKNADGYLAHGVGQVRPRWLAKLRGLRVISATWIYLSSSKNILLLGTIFGALFSLTVDSKYEKDDSLTKLWNCPNNERIDGIKIEQIAGKFLATIATTSSMYLFSDSITLNNLFSKDNIKIIAKNESSSSNSTNIVQNNDDNINISTSSSSPSSTISDKNTGKKNNNDIKDNENSLPRELNFITGNSGISSRRFIWSSINGVTHGQISIRRRRMDKTSSTDSNNNNNNNQRQSKSASIQSTVIADIVDKSLISWESLKGKTGFANPISCNLSSFHVLVLYPVSIFAFNHISGLLTQIIPLWGPNQNVEENDTNSILKNEENLTTENKKFLSSPVKGIIRDVLIDCLWIYTSNGELGKLIISNEEEIEAWKASKAMGRFDLAMALAPLVSSNGLQGTDNNRDSLMFQTREAVLEAQADHLSKKGDWDSAVRLYAKTNRPIENVILNIIDSCWISSESTSSGSAFLTSILDKNQKNETDKIDLSDLGLSSRLKTIEYVIIYLVNKLDKIDNHNKKPMQRTIISTLLIQLYSIQLSNEYSIDESGNNKKDEIKKDFLNFLVDNYKDLDFNTSINILSKNGCFEEIWNLSLLTGNILHACEISSRKGLIEECLSLLKRSAVLNSSDLFNQFISNLSIHLIPQSPKRIVTVVSRSLKKMTTNSTNSNKLYGNHKNILYGLTKVIRQIDNYHNSRQAYIATVQYLSDLLLDVLKKNTKTTNHNDDVFNHDWCNLIIFLFILHAEFGIEKEAQKSYDLLIVPILSIVKQESNDHGHVNNQDDDKQKLVKKILNGILQCSLLANYKRLCVYTYEALELYETSIELAIEIDLDLAEKRLLLIQSNNNSNASIMNQNVKRKLWRLIAKKSDDSVGVVERSKGILHIEDILNEMEPFECANEKVKSAVIHSLEEHKRLANDAKSQSVSTLQITSFLRQDVERVRAWQKEQHNVQNRRKTSCLTCGHSSEYANGTNDESQVDCSICGKSAIESINTPFTKGLSLPIKTRASLS